MTMPNYTVHTYYHPEDGPPAVKRVTAYRRIPNKHWPGHKVYEITETSGAAAKREAKRRRVADELSARSRSVLRQVRECLGAQEPEDDGFDYVLERVQNDGVCSFLVFMRNASLRGWTTTYSEAHRFSSKQEAEEHTGKKWGCDAKPVPVARKDKTPEESP